MSLWAGRLQSFIGASSSRLIKLPVSSERHLLGHFGELQSSVLVGVEHLQLIAGEEGE